MVAGVLRAALHGGSFVGEHGHIVRDVEPTQASDDLPRMAIPGAAVRLAAGSTVGLELARHRSAH
jgi:hypothetical protein